MRIPLILAAVLLTTSVLIDLYIGYDIKKSTRRNVWWKAYGVSAAVCWIFLLVVFFMPKRSESSGILSLMWMLYSYLSVYAAKLVYVVVSLLGRLVRLVGRFKLKWHPAQWLGLIAALGMFAAMWTGVCFTRNEIKVNNVEIASPKVPVSFNGYKIAQISDIHLGTWGNDTVFVSNLVDSINSLHPDLIVFTGDIVNRKTDELAPFINILSGLKAKDGVFSILGNHDYGDYVDWSRPEDRAENNGRLARHQAEMGWTLLNNEKRFISRGNDSIMLIGVENWGDPPFPVYGDLEKALSASPDSVYHQNDRRFKVLLTHNPEHWNQIVSHSTNIDLSLAGHTHAMQMMMELGDWKWSPARYRYEQWGGMYERLNDLGQTTKLYVNIGAGEVGMPARLFSAYPEITLFTLRHQGF